MRELHGISASKLRDKLGTNTGVVYVDNQPMFKVKNYDTPPDHVDTQATIPIYDRTKHKKGDRVLIRSGKNLIEAVVPEIDAEGNLVWE